MKEVLLSLLMWIGQESGLDYQNTPLPDVQSVSHAKLAQIMFNGEVPAGYNERGLLGLYQYKENAIYIVDSIDLETTYGQSVLLHELVHYMQFSKGMDQTVFCLRSLERLAYELQRDFLVANGETPPFSEMHIVYKSLCDDGSM